MASIKNRTGIPALTAQIVEAYILSNRIAISELPALITGVSTAIQRLAGARPAPNQAPSNPKKTVFRDYIICLEDGRRFRTLKRHLSVHYNLTPDAYRQKWGLPKDYPMVAPEYATRRSELAKKTGLGYHRTRARTAARHGKPTSS